MMSRASPSSRRRAVYTKAGCLTSVLLVPLPRTPFPPLACP
ncbi:hypothetical protein F383_29173 [Gossypium arboreum]|uniref:Uncharacterized protein n=1 Tax=Gossypium arboreum TaxID=29729 RepID=A0A0B0PED9_GOSAR|nr:hypothetical protein F383_29173 [Gossypium arboreum]